MSDQFFKTESNRIKPAEGFITGARAVLSGLVNSTNGVEGVLLATTDGFEVSSVFQRDYDGGKLSAVGSSILALVQALVNEAHLTGCRSVILDAENGKVMISAVPSANQPMIAIILTKHQVLLGQVMHGMNKAMNEIIVLDKKFNKTS